MLIWVLFAAMIFIINAGTYFVSVSTCVDNGANLDGFAVVGVFIAGLIFHGFDLLLFALASAILSGIVTRKFESVDITIPQIVTIIIIIYAYSIVYFGLIRNIEYNTIIIVNLITPFIPTACLSVLGVLYVFCIGITRVVEFIYGEKIKLFFERRDH